MAASSSVGVAAGSEADVMAQAQQREYPDFKEYFVTKPQESSFQKKHCRAEFLHSPKKYRTIKDYNLILK
jgi:hypothetical protein